MWHDLKAKAEQHMRKSCGIMITYPSTYGVFEEDNKRNLRYCSSAWRTSIYGWRKHECTGRINLTGVDWC